MDRRHEALAAGYDIRSRTNGATVCETQGPPARRRRGCPRRESAIARPPLRRGATEKARPPCEGGATGGRRSRKFPPLRKRPPAGAEAVHAASLRSPAPLTKRGHGKARPPLRRGGHGGVGAEEVPAAQKRPPAGAEAVHAAQSAIARPQATAPPYQGGLGGVGPFDVRAPQ